MFLICIGEGLRVYEVTVMVIHSGLHAAAGSKSEHGELWMRMC